MDEYGFYQDLGVKGKNPSKVSENAKIDGLQAPNSPYKFGSGKSKGTFKAICFKHSEVGVTKRHSDHATKEGRFIKRKSLKL